MGKRNSQFGKLQILREIKFGKSRVSKSAILTHFEALSLNFNFYTFLYFLKAEIDQINKIQSPENGKNDSFKTLRFSKIDFT